jgi:hypothetical protein
MDGGNSLGNTGNFVKYATGAGNRRLKRRNSDLRVVIKAIFSL